MINEGDKAPAFPRLTALKGATIVLYFYPKDDTTGCTVEACELRDVYPKLIRKKAVVLGVSPDSMKSHEKFAAKYSLPFELVPDEDHKIALAYGVWQEKSMYGRKYMGISHHLEPTLNVAKSIGISLQLAPILKIAKFVGISQSISLPSQLTEFSRN